ncbi:hypothetical protein [Chelatococcus reniformis]|uniref:Na+-dependent transporter n=1 Tax=Chelatococcus reniformis TaxID=1494448 RepID=A0A916URD7_9HYPH|nr:hypothetical protein [Chelatococcus reniformis]GGC84591.1 hypothetical protein GCM10010994_48130 [Chelatococcus reniformis]
MLRALETALATLGRIGTQGFVAAVVLGLLLPGLASAFRPLLPVVLFGFLALVFARSELEPIVGRLRRPLPLVGACIWLIVAPLALVMVTSALIGHDRIDPGLMLGLAVMAAAPPIISSPAIAILYGFEPALIIAAVVITTALTPFIAPHAAAWLAGTAVPLDASVLTLRLVGLIGGGIVTGLVVRAIAGHRRIVAVRTTLDGVVVLLFAVFATAAMDGVSRAAFERPVTVVAYLALAFALSLAGFIMTAPALRFLKPSDRFMLGYGTGQRNMGLLIAAMGAGTPDNTYLFFALAQIPIFVMPQLLQPIARRLRRDEEAAPIVSPPPGC